MNDQQMAFSKLSKLKVGALFMEMGTGKTKVALDLINSKKDKINYVLWICPCSIKSEIKNEIMKWYPDLDVEIIGVESISQSDKTFLYVYQKVKNCNTFMVVDESLKIKNGNAKRTHRIRQTGNYAKYRLILNGTPLSKNVLDLYTQMDFLSPKILSMSYNQFKNQYCEYYVRGKLRGLVKKQYNIEHLISLIKPYIFDSELEISSKKHYYEYEYSLDDEKEYQAIKEKFLSYDNGMASFMALATSLQKEYCSSSGKQVIVNNLIEEINERIVVFVKFLDSIPEGEISITGKTKEEDRETILNKFKNNEFKVLYITYGCGSFGLNLQFCRNVIFSEHTFDYAIREQSEARIYRLGQENDVNYYDVRCTTGLEKMIVKSLDKKSNLLNEVKTEIERVGEKEWLKNI